MIFRPFIKFSNVNDSYRALAVGVSGEGEAALGEGEESAEGEHRGEQGKDVEAGELLDRGADPLPHGQRTSEGGAGAVPGSGEEVQQGQETHQRLPAEVRLDHFQLDSHGYLSKSLFV